jgi:hypothetical protein
MKFSQQGILADDVFQCFETNDQVEGFGQQVKVVVKVRPPVLDALISMVGSGVSQCVIADFEA